MLQRKEHLKGQGVVLKENLGPKTCSNIFTPRCFASNYGISQGTSFPLNQGHLWPTGDILADHRPPSGKSSDQKENAMRKMRVFSLT